MEVLKTFLKMYGNAKETGFEAASIFIKHICWNNLKEVKHKIIFNSYDKWISRG